jgi:amino acid transporter
MAQRGELPGFFGRVHEGFRTPHFSIVFCSVVILALGLYGTFAATATLSAIARLIVYGATCAALVQLRRIGGPPAGWTLPAGNLVAALGIVFTVWLLSTRSFAQAWIVGVIVIAGFVVRLFARQKGPVATA